MTDNTPELPPIARSSLDLIGRTPMVEVTHIDTGPGRRVRWPRCARLRRVVPVTLEQRQPAK